MAAGSRLPSCLCRRGSSSSQPRNPPAVFLTWSAFIDIGTLPFVNPFVCPLQWNLTPSPPLDPCNKWTSPTPSTAYRVTSLRKDASLEYSQVICWEHAFVGTVPEAPIRRVVVAWVNVQMVGAKTSLAWTASTLQSGHRSCRDAATVQGCDSLLCNRHAPTRPVYQNAVDMLLVAFEVVDGFVGETRSDGQQKQAFGSRIADAHPHVGRPCQNNSRPSSDQQGGCVLL